MQVEDRVRSNVVFLGVFENGAFRPKATGFFVSVGSDYGAFLNLVTAEHVIVALQVRGHAKIHVRMNSSSGSVEFIETDASSWLLHPEAERMPTDVAVLPINLNGGNVRWLSADTSVFVTPESLTQREFGVGDEVFVVGLFRSHYGVGRNIPLVRIGSLAALPEEPVKTRWGYVEAYLIELHSIGGLSGSPVYIHRPPVQVKDGNLQFAQGQRAFLLGLVSGHFDVPNLSEDAAVDDAEGGLGINTGIGVVIPAHKVLETLDRPDLKGARDAVVARLRGEAATPDAGEA